MQMFIIFLLLVIGAGCKECTIREIEYCLSNDVIEDHCCCQRKYHEVFPYIAHTCYNKSRNCEPTVRDCGVFDRLLACCCHHYLGMKWKNQMSTTGSINGQSENTKNLFVFGLIILIIKSYYNIFIFL
uniref:CCC domain-containing protein n=1 Tax=Sipha flava TaxID=143950 RepID=A0A2S2QE44_9HEMI